MYKAAKIFAGKYPELAETIRQEFGLDRSNDFHATLNWYLCKFQRLTAVEQMRKTLGAGTNALDFKHAIQAALLPEPSKSQQVMDWIQENAMMLLGGVMVLAVLIFVIVILVI